MISRVACGPFREYPVETHETCGNDLFASREFGFDFVCYLVHDALCWRGIIKAPTHIILHAFSFERKPMTCRFVAHIGIWIRGTGRGGAVHGGVQLKTLDCGHHALSSVLVTITGNESKVERLVDCKTSSIGPVVVLVKSSRVVKLEVIAIFNSHMHITIILSQFLDRAAEGEKRRIRRTRRRRWRGRRWCRWGRRRR